MVWVSRRPLWGHGWIGGHGDLLSLALSSESPFCSGMSLFLAGARNPTCRDTSSRELGHWWPLPLAMPHAKAPDTCPTTSTHTV